LEVNVCQKSEAKTCANTVLQFFFSEAMLYLHCVFKMLLQLYIYLFIMKSPTSKNKIKRVTCITIVYEVSGLIGAGLPVLCRYMPAAGIKKPYNWLASGTEVGPVPGV
jgi:hypothetical protein